MSQTWFTYENGSIVEYDSVFKFPENCVGFVYKITNIQTGKFYIGRKSLYSNTKKKLTRAELAELLGPGRKPSSKIVTKESNWRINAINGSHYGLGQMRNKSYRNLDGYRQIDWTIRYINGRYGSMCNAYRHWQKKGWH